MITRDRDIFGGKKVAERNKVPSAETARTSANERERERENAPREFETPAPRSDGDV